MARNTNTQQVKDEAPAKAEAEKPKRRNLTPAERIAKMEAELAATREKAEAANKKKVDALLEKRNGFTAKIAEIQTKVHEVNTELASLGYTGPTEVDDTAAESAEG